MVQQITNERNYMKKITITIGSAIALCLLLLTPAGAAIEYQTATTALNSTSEHEKVILDEITLHLQNIKNIAKYFPGKPLLRILLALLEVWITSLELRSDFWLDLSQFEMGRIPEIRYPFFFVLSARAEMHAILLGILQQRIQEIVDDDGIANSG